MKSENPNPVPVLVAEDDELLSDSISEFLETWNFKVYRAVDCEQAKSILEMYTVNIALIDWKLKDCEGTEIMDLIMEQGLRTKMIMMTAYGRNHNLKEHIKKGTFDFLEKPFSLETLKKRLENAVRMYELEYTDEATELYGRSTFRIIGESPGIRNIRRMITMAAGTSTPVLIQGETGTGKELIARNIHLESRRSKNQFISVNCASIPETLFESEFFGYEKGAFTGAVKEKKGLFEIANFGILHLDEIGEMPVEFQAKLLRVLESGTFMKLGGSKEIRVDVRIIASTNKDLKEEVEKNRFREDLYFRIAVFNIYVPPLRERREDIPLIARHLLDNLHISMQRSAPPPQVDLEELRNRKWRGNIRELRNFLENRIIYDQYNEEIRDPGGIREPVETEEVETGPTLLEEVIRAHTLKILNQCGGNKTRAATTLGIGLSTLKRKLAEWEKTDSSR